jgi:phosphatidylinositol kinase/protein kinase (PI-3  family)
LIAPRVPFSPLTCSQVRQTYFYLFLFGLCFWRKIDILIQSISGVSPNKPEFGHTEAVPFRFTPNIQQFLTRQNIEGLLTSTLMAIGKVLVQREVRD